MLFKSNWSNFSLPRSNIPARKRPVTRNSGDFMEAVFRVGISRIFSNDFRLLPAGKHRILAGIHRNNLGSFRPEYCFQLPVISGVFLQDPVSFQHLSWRILRDPGAGIIVLGMTMRNKHMIKALLCHCQACWAGG